LSRSMARGLLAGLGLAWLVFLGFLVHQELRRASGDLPDFVRYPYLEAESCCRCHEETCRQWSASPHAKALSSLQPRNLSRAEKIRTCLPCHAPQPVLLTGLGKPPIPRSARRGEGVGCTTCHLGPGGLASARPGARGACRPVHQPALLSVELCQSCHNAHGTVDQWRQSEWSRRGVDCRGCHMPAGDHSSPGAHDSRTLSRALELSARVDGRALQVVVRNIGAGHNIPSGRRSRSLDLVVHFQPSGAVERFRFRNPFPGEGGVNTQLPSGKARVLSWPLPSGSGSARVRLLFQFRPGQRDSVGTPVRECTVDW